MTDLSAGRTTHKLADVVREHLSERPNKIAFKFEGDEVSYAALDSRMSQVANGLIALGLKPNERVGYIGKNSHLYFEMMLGVSRAGGVTCPINWRLSGREMAFILNDSGARIVFVGPEFLGALRKIQTDLPNLEHIICMEPHDDLGETPLYTDWRSGQSDGDPGIVRGFEDDAVQMYTSGTTGNPKGAILTNANLLGMRERERVLGIEKPVWSRWSPDDVSLVAMPCFHIGGTAWGLTGLCNGATGVVMREFDPNAVLDFIDEHRISKLFMVPAAMKIVLEHPRAREVDYSPLKYMLYGASPIPLDLLRKAMEVFQCGFVQMYGMTETAGTIVALPPEDHDPEGNERMRSAGKALDGVDVAILDDTGTPVASGEVGEIAARTVMNMKGYWNLPEATASTLTGDGWLRTGDAGYMDKDGYIFIHDRVKDMIISGGENIYPAEVENAIYGHPKLADVAVIGVPDDKWGEAVKAVVVPKPGESVSAQEVIAWARERIAAYKCPKSVDIIDALPRNPSGKILRKDLRAPYWGKQGRAVN